MVFELGILAVLRFDTSNSARTGSIWGLNATWILLVLQEFRGPIHKILLVHKRFGD